MSKRHIVFLTEQEITDMANLCRVTLKMAEDSTYFQKLTESAHSVLVKLMEKKAEIDETDRK